MSEDSSKYSTIKWPPLPWGPVAATILTILVFFILQQVAAVIVVLLPHILGWDALRADSWAIQSPLASFIYVVIAEGLIMTSLFWFLSYKQYPFAKAVGLDRPRWLYVGYVLLGCVVYYALFALSLLAAQFLPIDLDQEQSLMGFQYNDNSSTLAMAFISLVVLPPLVEEIIFRGFFYGTLRSARVSILATTFITSVIFASLHLFGSANGGLLWIAALDTFVLSVVLCQLRERTGSIWPGIGVHAVKNALVFVNLFILTSS